MLSGSAAGPWGGTEWKWVRPGKEWTTPLGWQLYCGRKTGTPRALAPGYEGYVLLGCTAVGYGGSSGPKEGCLRTESLLPHANIPANLPRCGCRPSCMQTARPRCWTPYRGSRHRAPHTGGVRLGRRGSPAAGSDSGFRTGLACIVCARPETRVQVRANGPAPEASSWALWPACAPYDSCAPRIAQGRGSRLQLRCRSSSALHRIEHMNSPALPTKFSGWVLSPIGRNGKHPCHRQELDRQCFNDLR